MSKGRKEISAPRASRLRRFARLAGFARLKGFARGEHGVAAIEFALVLPIMALLMLGCFEVPRFVMVYQKLARTSAGVSDLVAQADDPLLATQIADIYTAGQITMQPYDVVANGVIIVSSINNPGGTGVKLTWQSRKGSVATASKLGAQGSNPSGNLPAGLIPAADEEVLAAEVYFNFVPVFKNYLYQGAQLYMVSYTRPRNHNLTTSP